MRGRRRWLAASRAFAWALVMLAALGWSGLALGAETGPEPGGAAAAQAQDTQPEPQTPHEAGQKQADAEQPSPAAPPPSPPAALPSAPAAPAAAQPETAMPAEETPALTPESELQPFGYAFFANAPETFAPVPDTPVPRDYLLGPGDKLRITFWSSIGQETTLEAAIDARGQVHVPLLGMLTASGVTIERFEQQLLAGLRRHFAHVEGQVTLASLRSLRVLVAGEAARPGAYTVSSLSSAFNVLYQAGGPNRRGSMRSIRLLRGDRVVGEIDLYQFLLSGRRVQDYKLMTGDTLFIPVAGKVVGIRGEVRRPALYELLPGESLADLVRMAGGMEPATYLRHLQIERIEDHERRVVLDLDLGRVLEPPAGAPPVEVLDGDLVTIYRVLDKRMNTVELVGQVARPGFYELKPEMRVSDLIKEAQGLRGEVYLARAEILRTNGDSTVSLIAFDLEQALNGGYDPPLQRWDRVIIYSPQHLKDARMVSVAGRVRRPGTYPRRENMRVNDLLFAAGGLLEEAYLPRANLVRAQGDGSRITLAIDLSAVVAGDSNADLVLRDGDQLVVYSQAEAEWQERAASVAGAVQRPGTYPRTVGMTLKDLLFQAGGLLPDAFLARANLTRYVSGEQRETVPIDLEALFAGRAPDLELRDRDYLLVYHASEVQWRDRVVRIEGAVQRPGAYERTQGMTVRDLVFQAGNLLPDAFDARANLTRVLPGEKRETIAVDLKGILSGSAPDIALRDRDQLQVYRRQEVQWQERVVRIEGAVQRPGAYERTEGMTLADLLFQAGGVLPQAAPWAEVARPRGAQGTAVMVADLERLRREGGYEDLVLCDGDRVLVPEVGQFQRAPSTVRIAGEVRFPGTYAVEGRGETLGHLLQRAGGIADDAFVEGAVFIRRIGNLISDYQEQVARQVQARAEARAQLQYQLELAKAAKGATLPLLPSTGSPLSAAVGASAVAVAPAQDMGELISSGRVPIDLGAIIADPGGAGDVPLEDGDALIVPRRPTTVLVAGAAVSPGAVLYEPGLPIDHYVRRRGGYDEDAAAARVVVLRADGTVLPRRMVRQVERGDVIVIPSRAVILRDKDMWADAGRMLAAAADAAVSLLLVREVW